MPTFAVAAKYTPEALAAVRKAGFASREPMMKSIAEQFGGKMLAVYWPASPDWDFVVSLTSRMRRCLRINELQLCYRFVLTMQGNTATHERRRG